MTGHQSHRICLFTAPCKFSQDRGKTDNEKERHHQAGDCEQRSPLIPQNVFKNELSKSHRCLILRLLVERGLEKSTSGLQHCTKIFGSTIDTETRSVSD